MQIEIVESEDSLKIILSNAGKDLDTHAKLSLPYDGKIEEELGSGYYDTYKKEYETKSNDKKKTFYTELKGRAYGGSNELTGILENYYMFSDSKDDEPLYHGSYGDTMLGYGELNEDLTILDAAVIYSHLELVNLDFNGGYGLKSSN